MDYLDRKSREVINMLSAKYSYKMDIAVKKEEAFKEGVAEGAQQKAATNLLRMKLKLLTSRKLILRMLLRIIRLLHKLLILLLYVKSSFLIIDDVNVVYLL